VLLCLNAAVDQQMSSTVDENSDMFMNTSMNESPYFVHEPSSASSNNRRNSAKVSHLLHVNHVSL